MRYNPIFVPVKKIILFLTFSLTVFSVFSQKNHTINGVIKDASNGELLIGVRIYVKETQSGVATNSYGFYALTLPEGKYTLVTTYIGYQEVVKTIDLKNDEKYNLELKPEETLLDDVIVTSEKQDKNITDNKMSVVTMDIKTVKKVPLLLGEVDVMKVIQLLPGVQAAGDGNTLSIVRGGNTDHNLVLLDEAVVYNPSHAIGFFSVFNGDAVKDFDMYKGGIPSMFGGRLASVMDIRMKEGNSKKYGVYGGIGLLTSRLSIEGPIKKDKSSFILSGRRSYYDLFFPLSKDLKGTRAYFGDLNAKINYTINDKNRIYFSVYTGKDKLALSELFGLGWGNTTATFRWNRILSSKTFVNTSLIYSRYNYNADFNISPDLNQRRINYINDYNFKVDFSTFLNPKNSLKYGLILTMHDFRPGKVEPITKESILTAAELPKKYSFEQAYYINHKVDVSTRFNIEYGARFSVYSNVGKGREFVYNTGSPNYFDPNSNLILSNQNGIIDTNNYKSGEFYNTYYGFEPRANMAYILDEKSSIKGSYNRMFQYLNLIQNTVATTGQEFWVSTSPYIKPQYADQFAVGYFRNFNKNLFEFSAEAYYKKMNNVPEVIDNADINFNEAIETQLAAGQGRAYGLELFLRKNKGNTTGWISYTLSKAERQTNGINQDRWYPFRYDRRHYGNIVISHDFTKRISLGAAFVYSTGVSVTVPVSTYYINNISYPLYSDRNAFKIPAYHRLDVSLTINKKEKPNKKYKNEGSWVISVYNIYNRKNYYSLTFQTDPETGKNQAVKTYLFGIIPSVTYNFKF